MTPSAAKTFWRHRARLSVLVSKYQLLTLCAIPNHQCLCLFCWHLCLVQKQSKMTDRGGNYTCILLSQWECYENDFIYVCNLDNSLYRLLFIHLISSLWDALFGTTEKALHVSTVETVQIRPSVTGESPRHFKAVCSFDIFGELRYMSGRDRVLV